MRWDADVDRERVVNWIKSKVVILKEIYVSTAKINVFKKTRRMGERERDEMEKQIAA